MRTITINTPGPQGPVGPQGIQGPSGSVDTSFIATTGSNTFVGNQIINGNVTVSGTASINTLVVNQTSLSTGSNQLGDAANDTQTLYGTVRIATGSLAVTGSVLVATAMSDANNAPLVAQNLTAYSSPFTQYIQIWKNSAGTILSSLRADGFFDISTGGITAPSITARVNGSAAAPVFSRSNNITTGIFFPTTNNIAISTNSTEALRVFSTQNVSIGTTTDSGYKLDVNGTLRVSDFAYFPAYATSVQRVQFNNGSVGGNLGYIKSSTNGIIQLADSSETDFNRLQFGGSTNLFPAIQRVSASLAIVDATGGTSGSLLIGTTASAGYALDVNGTMQVTGNINLPTSAQYIGRGIGDAIRFANAEVRVSVTTPTGNFSVYGPSYGLTAFRVMANGNTLVGTTDDPGYKLHVSGSGNFNNNLTVTGSLTMGGSIYTSGYIGYSNNSRYLQFNDADSLVRLQGFNGIRLMTYDTVGYTDVLKIDGNVATRTVQLTGSLQITGSATVGTGSSDSMLFVKNPNDVTGGTKTATFEHRWGVNALSQTQRYGVIVRTADATTAIGIGAGALQGYNYTTNAYGGIALNYLGGSVAVGRIILGTADDSAKFVVRGRGTTSATFGMLVEDSNGSSSFAIRDDGRVGIGTTSPGAALEVNGSVKTTALYTANWSYDAASNTKGITTQGAVAGDKLTLTDSNGYTGTGNQNLFVIGNTGFNPSSGTGTFNIINLIASISQSGTATGITRGIYVNPTVTSAANYRAIETTSGSVVFNHGATSLMFVSSSGFVGINTTTDNGNKLYVNGTAWIDNNLSLGNEGKLVGSFSGGLQLIAAQSNTAQNVRISQGVSTTFASASALLQVDSTTKGFLPPRMTNAQRLAISSPAVGLMVYCTDATEGLYIYKSTGWIFII